MYTPKGINSLKESNSKLLLKYLSRFLIHALIFKRASTSVLGNIPKTDIYESIEVCEEAQEFEGIKIIRYESSVFYANVENFTYKIEKLSGIDKHEIMNKINKRKIEHNKLIKKSQQLQVHKIFNFSFFLFTNLK